MRDVYMYKYSGDYVEKLSGSLNGVKRIATFNLSVLKFHWGRKKRNTNLQILAHSLPS